MIDPNLQQHLREKYNPDGSTLRKAQLRMTEMLVFLDEVCTKYHLRYWLGSGTLLGACRHGGFIPWDDDTDVCMPIDDLHKLKKIMASEHLSDEFVLQTPENDKNYLRIEWCVLRDLKSEYIQDNRFHRGLKYKGLQIDIFPMERGVSTFCMRLINIYHYHILISSLMCKYIPYRVALRLAKILRPIEVGAISIIRPLNKKSSRYCSYGYGCGIKYHRHLIENIFPLKKALFEGKQLNVPDKSDAYLTELYGDWRKLPALNEIHTHNVEIKFYDEPKYKV